MQEPARCRRSNARQSTVRLRPFAFTFALSCLATAAACPSASAAPQSSGQATSLQDKIRKAFSLAGHWNIVKLDVRYAADLSNPTTLHEAAAATGEILIASSLGESGAFDVDADGHITGSGTANYQFRVAAGSSAFSGGPATPLFGLSVVIPVGAVAMMDASETGVREFSITGQADLAKRTISLNAFTPSGGPLKLIIRPGGSQFSVPVWPPMTNVSQGVLVEGASLLLRASGMVGKINVAIEAVKYVDLQPLFEAMEAIGQRGPAGPTGSKGGKGDQGPAGSNGSPGPAGSPGANGNSGSGGNSGSSSSTSLAGTVTVPIGGSIPVRFRTPLASTNYAVSLTASTSQGPLQELTSSDKTTSGFTVHVFSSTSSASGSVKVDWIVVAYQ
jgi:Collagen triple helix repeat (20 copies)